MNVAAPTFAQALMKVLAFWKKYEKSDSLVRFTQTTRVEPIVMIDNRAQHLAYLPDTLQSLLSLFAAYYLQGAALQVNVGRINVGKFLNPLNPDRPFLESLNPALEAFASSAQTPLMKLPSLESDVAKDVDILTESGQAIAEDALKAKTGKPAVRGGSFAVNDGLSKDLKEAANLSVGRVFNVEISDEGHKASIPVLIRLLATMVPPDLLVHILSDGARVANSTRKERWYAYKTKDLKFWRDLVFTQDLIDEHKQALLKDTNGVYQNLLKRRAKNGITGLLRAEPTVGTASNLLVLTRQTVRELEAAIGGKFDNPSVRNKIFEASYLMIAVVIDPDYDHVTFYHRGVDQSSELSVRDIKVAAKSSGPDVGELLKMYVMGQAPSF